MSAKPPAEPGPRPDETRLPTPEILQGLPQDLVIETLRAELRRHELDDRERESAREIMIDNARYERTYRSMAMFLGTVLGLAAIGLGAHAVSNGANLFGIAAVITPIAALVGIFAWGNPGRKPAGSDSK